jgi:integrase
VRRGLIRRNPAATVEIPRATPARPRVWTHDEATAFLVGSSNDRLHTLYRLLLLTGLRRGEAVGLQWADVDLANGTLTVNRQVVSVNGELIVGPPKSDAGRRTIALDRTTRQLLEAQHRRALLAHPWEPDETFGTRFIFTRSRGQCLNPTHVSQRFTTLTRQLGLPRIRLHDLRHTSASLGLAGGESLVEVSRRLGHSSIGITADVYSHITAEGARESADRLARRLEA